MPYMTLNCVHLAELGSVLTIIHLELGGSKYYSGLVQVEVGSETGSRRITNITLPDQSTQAGSTEASCPPGTTLPRAPPTGSNPNMLRPITSLSTRLCCVNRDQCALWKHTELENSAR